MVNLRMRKTMKRNKVKKHQKYSRKHKKTIKQKRQHKRGKYSKTLRGGDICLKEVTDKTPPEVNRIGDENINLPKKSSWGFGSLFGNKKTETPPIETTPIETPPIETTPIETTPIETTPIETTPIEEVKIVDEKITDDIKNPLLSPEIEDTSIVSSPLQPGEAGFVKPPPPSTPNPYLNTTPNKIEDTTIEKSEIIEDSTSPPLPPVESKNPNNMLDQIKEGVKLKSVNKISNIPPPPPGTPTKDTNVFQQGLLEKFKNTGMNQEEEEEEEEDINNTWRDSEGGKTRRRRRNKKSTRKNAKKVSKKQ